MTLKEIQVPIVVYGVLYNLPVSFNIKPPSYLTLLHTLIFFQALVCYSSAEAQLHSRNS